MSTTGEQTSHYCNKYAVFCTGANGHGECNTTVCWNSQTGVSKVRLIDADAMSKRRIDYIVDGYAESVNDMTEWGMALIEAPTVGGWISCSERLPEEEGEYLIWCVSYDISTGDKITITNAYGISYYDTQFGAWTGVHIGGFLWNEVVAWMPLPKPYKEQTERSE